MSHLATPNMTLAAIVSAINVMRDALHIKRASLSTFKNKRSALDAHSADLIAFNALPVHSVDAPKRKRTSKRLASASVVSSSLMSVADLCRAHNINAKVARQRLRTLDDSARSIFSADDKRWTFNTADADIVLAHISPKRVVTAADVKLVSHTVVA